MNISKMIVALAVAWASLAVGSAQAAQSVEFFPSVDHQNKSIQDMKLIQQVGSLIDLSAYRAVHAQIIDNPQHQPDSILIYLHSNTYHRVDFAKAKLVNGRIAGIVQNYQPTEYDHSQQLDFGFKPKCPDESIEFISVCPNDNSFEINITNDVGQAAIAKGLKTKILLKGDAATKDLLNYMSCPNLKGMFYDGDANPSEIVTGNGTVNASKIKKALKGALRYKVINIWLACEAFNNPLHDVMIDDVQSQKYAAGINDLLVGPSDNAAACAMKAAINGDAVTAAFNNCYKTVDDPQDQWGFDGKGADYFGQ